MPEQSTRGLPWTLRDSNTSLRQNSLVQILVSKAGISIAPRQRLGFLSCSIVAATLCAHKKIELLWRIFEAGGSLLEDR